MEKIIIDANNSILGRLCSFAAKKALEGNEIVIVNCEKAIITGNKKDIIHKYSGLKLKGANSLKGPKYFKQPQKILKRSIKKMLPDFRKGFGKKISKQIKCYEGIPKQFEGEKMIKSKKTNPHKYIELKELSEKI